MTVPRGGQPPRSFADGRVLVAGGMSRGQSSPAPEIFNPASGRFTATAGWRSPATRRQVHATEREGARHRRLRRHRRDQPLRVDRALRPEEGPLHRRTADGLPRYKLTGSPCSFRTATCSSPAAPSSLSSTTRARCSALSPGARSHASLPHRSALPGGGALLVGGYDKPSGRRRPPGSTASRRSALRWNRGLPVLRDQKPACGEFCVQCGTALALACPSCGAPHAPDQRFFSECGTALAAPAAETPSPREAPAAERRLVTVLFADLVGFTAASEERDAEDTREPLSRYFDRAAG